MEKSFYKENKNVGVNFFCQNDLSCIMNYGTLREFPRNFLTGCKNCFWERLSTVLMKL